MDNRKASFGYRFAMLHRFQMAMCRKEILGEGLQPSQLPFIVNLVHETEPVTQDHLSASLAIDKGTTARALGQLEKNGYVTRKINPDNRRQNLVSPTQKACDVAEKLLPCLDKATAVFIEGFNDDERRQVLDLLDRMLSNARKAVDQM